MTRFRLSLVLLLVAFCALRASLTTYAVAVSDDGAARIYRTAARSSALGAFAFVCVISGAILTATARIGLLRFAALLYIALAASLGIGNLGSLVDRVRITNTTVDVPTGGLVHANAHVRIDELEGVTISPLGNDVRYAEVVFTLKDSSTVVVPAGDLWNAAEKDVQRTLLAHGISIVDLR